MRTPKSILISRTDKIGDVILTLPLAAYIKEQDPTIQVGFLCKSYTAPIVHLSPFVDSVFTLEEMEKIPSFEAILHVFPSPEVARWAKKQNISIRIGTSHRLYHWLYCNKLVHFSRKNSELHEAQLNFFLLKPIFHNHIPSLEALKKYVKLNIPPIPLPNSIASQLDVSAFKVILHPRSKGSAREWPIDYYEKLIQLLKHENIQFIITGTEEEKESFKHILLKNETKVLDLAGKLTLEQLIKLISSVDALVAASTGPLHIAAALGIHTIGLFPPIRPMHPGRWQPIGHNVHIFVKNVSCNRCKHNLPCSCMEDIQPEEVAELLVILKRNKGNTY
jgi:ADP-heptose:LPS heptosyltransferase